MKGAIVSDQQLQRVKVKRLAHVGLWSTDVVAQTRFYQQIMGFDLRTAVGNANDLDIDLDDATLFLALGDEHHCLGLFNDTRPTITNGRKPTQRTQLHHLAFEVDTDAELAALAARLQLSGIKLQLQTRDSDSEMGDTLWFNDPDGNRIEIMTASDDLHTSSSHTRYGRRNRVRPYALQHISLHTMRLEEMVDFYTEALGFDISDWLLRESAWLRCNTDHHTIMFTQGRQSIDHIGYSVSDGPELLRWADHLSRSQTPLLWGPGRHGAGNDLFVRFADPDGIHIELSAEVQQYYDRDVTTPPRLWHTRSSALNLWGTLPSWLREEVRV